MTKKDYQLIADVIKRLKASTKVKQNIITDFTIVLKLDNPRFNTALFANACYHE